jgi:hypothetical protein
MFSAAFEEGRYWKDVDRLVRAEERYVPTTADVQSIEVGQMPSQLEK